MMKKGSGGKIKRLSDLTRIVARLKKKGKKIVHCHGVFDLIHPGHIRHFASAKKYGDVLVVTLTADNYVKKGPGRPIFNQQLRSEVLSSIEDIDYVAVVFSPSAVEAIKKIAPHYYVKGPDYQGRKPKPGVVQKLDLEAETVKAYGGTVIFTQDDIIFSSSKLINDYLDVYPSRTKKYLSFLLKSHTADSVVARLATLKTLKVLVVGDAIIDQYHYCAPLGKSSKEPVMVHQYLAEESFLGGALATANHVASLSDNVTLVTVLGKKRSFRRFIGQRLKKSVTPVFYYQRGIDTIVKRRYVDGNTKQKLFQVSYLKDEFIDEALSADIAKFLKKEIKKFDLVIVNDFGHGLFTDQLISTITNGATYLALNVQANSANYGFNVITKYPQADFVCIDEQEIRLATHNRYGALETLIKRIFVHMCARYMIITRGFKGSLSYASKVGFHEAPALTDRVVDRVGAGDALFAICAPCIRAGFPHELIPFLGNVAGALQVQTVGNRKPVEFDDLRRFIERLLK